MSSTREAPNGLAEPRRLALARWLFSPLAGIRLGDYLGLLRRYGGGIPPAYWPRSTFTLAMSGLNSVLAGREGRRYGATIAATRVERPVFVLGHHRSGTTHLWNLLAQDARFAYPTVLQAVFPHTFLTFEGIARRGAERFAPRRRPQDNVRFSADAPIEEERAICTASQISLQMARHFPRRRADFQAYLTLREADPASRAAWFNALDTFARKLLIRYGADRTLLFKAPDHTGKVARILERYPDARFIHIHRDPYTVYRSTHKMERDTIPLYAYQRPDWAGLDDFILWRYRTMVQAFLADRPQIPAGQFTEVGFTELERDPIGVLERLYGELDLPAFATARPAVEAYIASLADYRKNRYPPLPETTRARVAEAWGFAFEHWGYPV